MNNSSLNKIRRPGVIATAAPGLPLPTTQLKIRRRWNATDLAMIAVFASLLAASVAVPGINVGPFGVALTLQTLVVSLCGLVLGFGRGTAAVSLYILIGFIGLPIFSGFRAGPAVLASPSAGYILGFILGVAVIGLLAPWALRMRFKGAALFGAATIGMVVTHASGIVGFMAMGMGLAPAVIADAVYIPGDLLKNALAVIIALSIHRAFPDLLVRRRR